MLRPVFYWGAVTALLAAGPVLAVSTPIAGPGSYGVGATTLAAEPDLAGTVLAQLSTPFTILGSAGASVSGTIDSSVLRSDATGYLHFYHALTVESATGFAPGSYLEWLEFDPAATGDPVAVGRRTDGLGSPTGTIYDLAASGMSRYDFNLIDLDGSAFTTQLHLRKTTATAFALTGLMQVQGYEFVGNNAVPIASQWLATYAPAVVPEPASWSLMITGFALAGAALRRRRPATA